jgi:pimeloyl-ACP methyl ester carboxylesterase
MYWRLRGERIHAATGGRPFEAGRPSVVFLHGSSLDHRFWDGHTGYFAERGYAVLAPDLPGHGRSSGKPLVSVEDMAQWLHELVRLAGAGRLSLVGHSQGALVALEFAARFGELPASLSCVASGLATPVNPQLLAAAREDPPAAVAMMVAWALAPSECLADPALPRKMEDWMCANARSALAADLRACDNYRNGTRAVTAIRCPAQVVVGELDRMAPSGATEALIAALDHPRVDRLSGAGHMLPMEKPGHCLDALGAFIGCHNPPQPVGSGAGGDSV